MAPELAEDKDVQFKSKKTQEQVVAAEVGLEEEEVSGSIKRKLDDEVEVNVKQLKKDE